MSGAVTLILVFETSERRPFVQVAEVNVSGLYILVVLNMGVGVSNTMLVAFNVNVPSESQKTLLSSKLLTEV